MQAPIFGYVLTDNLGGKFPVGKSFEVRCRHGFLLDGPSTIVCSRTGAWIGGSATCKREITFYKSIFFCFKCQISKAHLLVLFYSGNMQVLSYL